MDAFRKKDVGLPGTVRIGHDSGHPETKTEIKLTRVGPPDFPETVNRTRNIGVQIGLTQTRFIVVVVAAQPQGQRATASDDPFQIGHERSADTPSAMRLGDNERVKFPDPAAIHRDPAYPPEYVPGTVERDSADSFRRERFGNLLTRGGEILPVVAPASKRVAKEDSRLFQQIRRVSSQIDDRSNHRSLFRYRYHVPLSDAL